MEIGLSPGDIVLDRDPAPPKKGTAPNFRPMSIVAKRLYILGYVHLVRRYASVIVDIVVDGDPAPLPQKGAEPPIFGPFML